MNYKLRIMKTTLHFIGQRLTVNGKRGRTVHRFPFTVYLIALAIALAIAGCKEDAAQQDGNVKIDLLAPVANTVVTSENFPLAFSWKAPDGAGPAELYISVDATFPESAKTLKYDAADASAYTVEEADFELMLAAGEVDYSDKATIYWKVRIAAAEASSAFTAYRRAQPEVMLAEPADRATIDANRLDRGPVFTWTTIPEANAYTLKFSTVETFPADTRTKTYDAGNKSAYSFISAAVFDNMLKGIGVGSQGAVYWTVSPVTDDGLARTPAHRSFTAIRITPLLTPAFDEKAIVTRDLAGNFTLTWKPKEGVTSYEVVIATDAALTNGLYTGTANAATHAISWATVQGWITDPDNHFKRYKANELYWDVRANGTSIAEGPGRFRLYGQRLLRDDRAADYTRIAQDDPDKTYWLTVDPQLFGFTVQPEEYEVAVLEYNGKEVVWLAEDLRATVPMGRTGNGNPGINLLDNNYHRGYYMPTTAIADDGITIITIPEKYRTLRTTVPRTGLYYDNVQEVANASPLPLGWRLPSASEWQEMFEAARATYGGAFGDNVIRHPEYIKDGVDKTHANEWGMNFIPLGHARWHDEGTVSKTDFFWNDEALAYQPDGDINTDVVWNGAFQTVGSANRTLFRAIYTGDDE
jgi:uncharacterized protein (TIGR02145 family)